MAVTGIGGTQMMVGRDRTHFALAGLGLAVLLTTVAGCDVRGIVMNRQHLDDGLVIILPGIEGRSLSNGSICQALCDEQIPLAVQVYDWTVPLGPVFNQCAYARNREAAAALARHIVEYRREHPTGRVFLIGHSGGTAIAVWAAEAMPPDQKIDGIILLASSLSPQYDLTEALARAEMGIVSFYSHHDAALLGAGTSLFGTMDRVNGESAGKVGFNGHSASYAAAAKLFQIPWSQKMAKTGYTGCHFSCCSGKFIATYIAPLITAGRWDRQLIANLGQEKPAKVASLRNQ